MTLEEVINKLVYEMIQLTGHYEDHKVYKTYIRIALSVGSEYFPTKDNQIVAYDSSCKEVGRFNTILQASKRLKINPGSISKVLRGKRHLAGGLTFVKEPIN